MARSLWLTRFCSDNWPTKGSWVQGDNFGTQLQSSHPFSLVKPLQDNIDLISTLVSQGKTGDPTGAIHLVMGNVECTSCHNPHVQGTDKLSTNFLVRDSSNGQMCLACHDPTRTMFNGKQTVNPHGGMGRRHPRYRDKQSLVAGQGGQLRNGRGQRMQFLPCHA